MGPERTSEVSNLCKYDALQFKTSHEIYNTGILVGALGSSFGSFSMGNTQFIFSKFQEKNPIYKKN